LASAYDQQGHYGKALEYNELALEMRERLHKGKDHADIANSLNS
jgi:hypothetical protein